MKKPCDNCTTNIDQAILYDEITCYLTCKIFKRWQKWASANRSASNSVACGKQ